jgi:hypothetical protein
MRCGENIEKKASFKVSKTSPRTFLLIVGVPTLSVADNATLEWTTRIADEAPLAPWFAVRQTARLIPNSYIFKDRWF